MNARREVLFVRLVVHQSEEALVLIATLLVHDKAKFLLTGVLLLQRVVQLSEFWHIPDRLEFQFTHELLLNEVDVNQLGALAAHSHLALVAG